MISPSNFTGPISQRYRWCCGKGCGYTEAVLVEFRTYHQETDGVTTAQRTEPRLVSACCHDSMFIYDRQTDEAPDDMRHYYGKLAKGL